MNLTISRASSMLKGLCGAALALALASTAGAQTFYTATFNDAADPNPGPYISDSGLSGQNNWVNSDPYTGFYGGSDFVNNQTYPGYTDGKQGGIGPFYFHSQADKGEPSVATSYLYPTAAATGLNSTPFSSIAPNGTTLDVDMSVIKSFGAGAANQDAFGWTYRDNLGNSIVALKFTQSGVNPNALQISYSVNNGASTTVLGSGLNYSGNYHLTLAVMATSFTATFTDNTAPANTLTFSNNAVIGGNTVDNISATLYSVNPSSNAANTSNDGMTFDNYRLSEVPEPSTYAMMGIGLLSTLGMATLRRSRSA